MDLKQGDLAIVTTLCRTTKGLQITVRCHEAVEDFMRANAAEELTPVELIGRMWKRVGGETPLEVYEMPQEMNGCRLLSQKVSYRLDQPGRALVSNDQFTGARTINMSFLRLVGTSAPDGITFSVAGVHSDDDVIWIASSIRDASRAIYNQYMKPMQISVELEEHLPPAQQVMRGTPVIIPVGEIPF